MPAVALSRVGARVVESGPGGEDLAAATTAPRRNPPTPQPRLRQMRTFTEHAGALVPAPGPGFAQGAPQEAGS